MTTHPDDKGKAGGFYMAGNVGGTGILGALALWHEHQNEIALLLTDVVMPGMDGLECTRRIRSDPQLAKTPVIALTALAMEGDRDRCLTAGASQYLSKPVKLKQLAALIHQLLGGSS